MSILTDITADLDWREKEIASMRLLLSSPGITVAQKKVLLRAAWALLYAHYEGFCKNTLTAFYDWACRSGVVCNNLPSNTKLLALDKKLKSLKNLPNLNLIDEIAKFDSDSLLGTPQFPEVNTNSNLYPNVLIDLMKDADLNIDRVLEHRAKIKTLVERRNKIAHGESNFIDDVSYYLTYEHSVYDVIYDLAFQVDNRLSKSPYV